MDMIKTSFSFRKLKRKKQKIRKVLEVYNLKPLSWKREELEIEVATFGGLRKNSVACSFISAVYLTS